jgi:serine/threonine protein phosphatase PrpC
MLPMRVGWATDPGRVHPTNEDSFAVFEAPHGTLLVVCDGMGGMGRGDEASQLAVKSIYQSIQNSHLAPPAALAEALHAADYSIRRRLCSSGRVRPGSTAAIAYVTKAGVHIGWIGDSPTYHLRAQKVLARTRDHKLVEDLVDQGEITREEAAASPLSSVLTRALGGRPPSPVEIEPGALPKTWNPAAGDHIVLCSDGLCDLVTGAEIAAVVAEFTPEDASHELVRMANSRGGHDNITVIVAKWGEGVALSGVASNTELENWLDGPNEHATDPHGLALERNTLPPDQDLEQVLDNRTFEFAPPRDLNPIDPVEPPEDRAAGAAVAAGLLIVVAAIVFAAASS